METLIDILQSLEFSSFQLAIACFLFLAMGYWNGKRKARRLRQKINRLERHVMDLNAELLFGTQQTKVIRLRKPSTKKKAMAQ